MVIRIRHLGDKSDQAISVGGYTLQPGFTSPNIEIQENSNEHDAITRLVRDNKIELLPADPDRGARDRSTLTTAVGGRGKMSSGAVRAKMEMLGRGAVAQRNAERERAHQAVGGHLTSSRPGVRIFSQEQIKSQGFKPPKRVEQTIETAPKQDVMAKRKGAKFTAEALRDQGMVPPEVNETLTEEQAEAKTVSTIHASGEQKTVSIDEIRSKIGMPTPPEEATVPETAAAEDTEPSDETLPPPPPLTEEEVDEEEMEEEEIPRAPAAPDALTHDSIPELNEDWMNEHLNVATMRAFCGEKGIDLPKGSKKADIIERIIAWCKTQDPGEYQDLFEL